MIAFLEEGDYGVLNTKIKKIIKKHSENGYIDESDYYNHRFVYSSVLVDSDRKSFIVKHILMSFV
jgi:hypothetical protein